jgi:uncharacterized membrane protein
MFKGEIMEISFEKYPVDMIVCIIWSIFLLPIAILDIESSFRIILGLPFILFIPGYVLIFSLFPARKTDRGIDIIERVALSFGLSIAVVSLIGLGLNYTPWRIRLESIFISIFLFVELLGLYGIFRWIKTDPSERFFLKVDLSFPKEENRFDKILTLILAISIIIAVIALFYVIVTPKVGEKFTEFYLLGPDGIADDYPKYLNSEENASVIIGVVNHEYKKVNYTIEIWLINQSLVYNESKNQNETLYHHMWFKEKFTISLDHIPINIEEQWEPQWEQNYSFNIKRKGDFKLAFLLFTNLTEDYIITEDYKGIAEQKINNAYREIHLWINVD